jgi:hypothetical protein
MMKRIVQARQHHPQVNQKLDFALLPYHDDKGQQITTTEQAPDDDPDFYKTYYHNHRVLTHGNLTGMVKFRCSVSRAKLKHINGDYFRWFHRTKVFINQTKLRLIPWLHVAFW